MKRRVKKALKKSALQKRVLVRKSNTPARKHFKEHAGRARELVLQRLEYFNTLYGFLYGTVRIKNQKSRWGSCSKKGNLNFNYRIVLLPPHLADYIVVHELCHLGEFNHSQNFWNLVARAMPDFAERRAELKKIWVR